MAIYFRPYETSDKTALGSMILNLYADDPSVHVMSLEKANLTIETLSRHPSKGQIIVFEQGGEVVGYAILIFYWSNERGGDVVMIDELFVRTEYRSQGVGGHFFDFLFQHYQDKATAFQLEVTPNNDRAYRFYNGLGFELAKNRFLMKHPS